MEAVGESVVRRTTLKLANALNLWQRAGMNANELRTLLRSTPFRQIRVCLGSNKTYRIPHPEFAALSPGGETLIVFLPNGGHDVVDVPLIERVEVRRRSANRS